MSHRFLRIVAGVVFAGLVLAVPAVASHVEEPDRPIEALGLKVYPYPNLARGIQDCLSGDEVFQGSDFARVEPVLTVQRDWPDRAAPSEHYTVIYQISTTAHFVQPNGTVRTRLAKRSGGHWQHQNTAAHSFNPSEAVQWNEWQIPNGPVHIEWEFRGLISGKSLKVSCDFVVVDSPVRDVIIDR